MPLWRILSIVNSVVLKPLLLLWHTVIAASVSSTHRCNILSLQVQLPLVSASLPNWTEQMCRPCWRCSVIINLLFTYRIPLEYSACDNLINCFYHLITACQKILWISRIKIQQSVSYYIPWLEICLIHLGNLNPSHSRFVSWRQHSALLSTRSSHKRDNADRSAT